MFSAVNTRIVSVEFYCSLEWRSLHQHAQVCSRMRRSLTICVNATFFSLASFYSLPLYLTPIPSSFSFPLGIRPDLRLLSLQLMSWEWFVEMQAHHYKGVKFPGHVYHPRKPQGFSIKTVLYPPLFLLPSFFTLFTAL